MSEPGSTQYMHPQDQQQPSDHVSGDPSLDALGVPLATVHEGAEVKIAAAVSNLVRVASAGASSGPCFPYLLGGAMVVP